MPANVTIDYAKAKEKFTSARTSIEKLAALEEMRRFAPKHKGAEKLRAEISQKTAKIKREIEKEKTAGAKRGSAQTISVKKEGAAQIVMVGLPNSGKSSLLKKLTGIDVAVAPYEFTTVKPELGMMDYQGARIQLVELPALVKGSSTGKAQGSQILSVVRTADAVVICSRSKEDAATVIHEMENARIILNEKKPNIEIKPSPFRGINITGRGSLSVPKERLITFLNNAGVRNADVIVGEKNASLDRFARVLDERIVYKNAVTINPFENEKTGVLKERLFSLLGKILVFTKKPGEDADTALPLVVDKGSTVEKVARIVHKDIARKLKYTRVWGSTKFAGQRVSKGYVLKNRDIMEVSA
jgi:small GTP-binding protein